MKTKLMKKQKGATLLEALAFLGIAAIVVVGAISMFRSAQGSAQSNDMVGQLNGLRSSVKTIFGSQALYGSAAWSNTVSTQALNQTLINGKAVPDTLRISGANITNSFNGSVQIDGDANSFWIKYNNVPQEVCVKVAPQTGSSWLGLSINGTYTATDTAVFPVASAVAQCAAGSSNSMIWRAR